VVAELQGLAQAVCQAALTSPSIVVIGEVVNQRVISCAPEPAAVEMPIPLPGAPEP
jgi:uroporphyrin-III C-methyltransferase